MPKIDLSYITETYFSDFDDPNVINHGWCFVWAWMAHLHVNAAHLKQPWPFITSVAPLKLLTVQQDVGITHAFVQIGSRYFDSSQPQGVRAMRSLYFFEGYGITRPRNVTRQHPTQFRRWWRIDGRADAFEQQGLRDWPSSVEEAQ